MTTTIIATRSVYLVAQSTPPVVVCPAWCTTSQAHHLDELRAMDGRAGHMSAGYGIDTDNPNTTVELHLTHTTLADGAPDTEDDPVGTAEPTIVLNGTELTLHAAQTIAASIYELVALAHRAEPPR